MRRAGIGEWRGGGKGQRELGEGRKKSQANGRTETEGKEEATPAGAGIQSVKVDA